MGLPPCTSFHDHFFAGNTCRVGARYGFDLGHRSANLVMKKTFLFISLVVLWSRAMASHDVWVAHKFVNTGPSNVDVVLEVINGLAYDTVPAVTIAGNTIESSQFYFHLHTDDDNDPTQVAYDFKVSHTAASLVGNSYILTGGSSDTAYGGWTVTTAGHDTLLTAADGGTVDVTQIGEPTADSRKTKWLVSDDGTVALTTAVFREGIDKLAAGGGSSSAVNMTDTNAKLDSVISNTAKLVPADQSAGMASYTTATNSGREAYTESLVGDGAATIAVSSIKSGFSGIETPGDHFALAPSLAVLGHEFKFEPFAFMADLRGMLAWIREALLWGMFISFCWFTQKKFETYSLAAYAVGQTQTKPEPAQNFVPAVGWTKQVALALAISSAFVVAIGATITMFNTELNVLLSGVDIWHVGAHIASRISAMYGDANLVAAFELSNCYLPLSAALEFTTAHLFIAWSLPVIWGGALYTAKFFQL